MHLPKLLILHKHPTCISKGACSPCFSLLLCFVNCFKITWGRGYVCDYLPSDVIFAFTPSSNLQALFGHGENYCFWCHLWSVLCMVFLVETTQSNVPVVPFGYCTLCEGHLLLKLTLALGCLVPPQHQWWLGSRCCRSGTVLLSRLLFVFQPVLIHKRGAAKTNSHLKRPFQRHVYQRWRDVNAPHMLCKTQPACSGVAFDVEELWT